jgi:hypothetical protein
MVTLVMAAAEEVPKRREDGDKLAEDRGWLETVGCAHI